MYAGAVAISAEALAREDVVNCILLCPEQSSTRPKSTRRSVADPPPAAAAAVTSTAAMLAGVGGSTARKKPAASAVTLALNAPFESETRTDAAGAAQPHTGASLSASSTMSSPNTFENRKDDARATSARMSVVDSAPPAPAPRESAAGAITTLREQ